jgi:hypothetical protein
VDKNATFQFFISSLCSDIILLTGTVLAKKEIWFNKSNSFKEAQEFDDAYYLSMTPAERLETVQFLREEHEKLNKDKNHEGGIRLRRVLKFIKK